jgi:hypothetical protein
VVCDPPNKLRKISGNYELGNNIKPGSLSRAVGAKIHTGVLIISRGNRGCAWTD